MRGTAAALYLNLWNRGSASGDDLEVCGEATWIATWREQMQVRWS